MDVPHLIIATNDYPDREVIAHGYTTREGARGPGVRSLHVAAPSGVSAALPAWVVIRRQVWTKTTKDKTDVRKLVVWRTNKDGVDPSYPAYVVHWTDYSAGRKTPLAREVRPAPTLEAATALADAMVADNIKKGWEERGRDERA